MTGTEFALRAGGYEAVVTARAAALRQLRHRERDLIVPFPAGGPIPDYRGIIAAPWPNRIAGGEYRFAGTGHRLGVNEPDRDCALHGLAFGLDWTLAGHTDSSLELACSIQPGPGYPFQLHLTARYELDPDGLHTTVTATNAGATAAPYGLCPHPYLVAGPAPLDEWVLHFHAEDFLEVTPDRLLPVARRPVAGHAFDFSTPRLIGTTEIDHAFTGLAFDGAGHARLTLKDPGGTGVGMAWDRNSPWLQIHTADKPHPRPNRLGLAVEPMTCPPDAFNTGTDLIHLQPGTTHEASWSIFAA